MKLVFLLLVIVVATANCQEKSKLKTRTSAALDQEGFYRERIAARDDLLYSQTVSISEGQDKDEDDKKEEKGPYDEFFLTHDDFVNVDELDIKSKLGKNTGKVDTKKMRDIMDGKLPITRSRTVEGFQSRRVGGQQDIIYKDSQKGNTESSIELEELEVTHGRK